MKQILNCLESEMELWNLRSWKVQHIPERLIAGEINTNMEIHVINRAVEGFKRVGKEIRDSKIAVLGLAYKKDIDDSRESPSLAIIEVLFNLEADVRVYDPFVKEVMTGAGEFISSASVDDVLSGPDCAMFLLNHTIFKFLKLKELISKMRCPVVIDAKKFVYE